MADMKLFLISQNQITGWDTYDAAVVAAPDEETAKQIHPDGSGWDDSSWCSAPEHVSVRYLGEATGDVEQGVVCASFNQG